MNTKEKIYRGRWKQNIPKLYNKGNLSLEWYCKKCKCRVFSWMSIFLAKGRRYFCPKCGTYDYEGLEIEKIAHNSQEALKLLKEAKKGEIILWDERTPTKRTKHSKNEHKRN